MSSETRFDCRHSAVMVDLPSLLLLRRAGEDLFDHVLCWMPHVQEDNSRLTTGSDIECQSSNVTRIGIPGEGRLGTLFFFDRVECHRQAA